MTKDALYKQMYDEYKKGFSLRQVGVMFNLVRQSVYNGFKVRKYVLRLKIPLPYLFFNGKKYSLRNTGYYGLTNDDRRLIHRDVWEFYNGKIPPKHDIHHKDNDRSNNRIENLELYTKSEHSRRFNSGKNQYTKNESR